MCELGYWLLVNVKFSFFFPTAPSTASKIMPAMITGIAKNLFPCNTKNPATKIHDAAIIIFASVMTTFLADDFLASFMICHNSRTHIITTTHKVYELLENVAQNHSGHTKPAATATHKAITPTIPPKETRERKSFKKNCLFTQNSVNGTETKKGFRT